MLQKEAPPSGAQKFAFPFFKTEKINLKSWGMV